MNPSDSEENTGEKGEFEAPTEPVLNQYIGYDDCLNCYFRLSTLKRITRNVQKLKKWGL